MAIADDDIITGEAVAVEVVPASFGSRMLSGLIDAAVLGISFFLLLLATAWTATRLNIGLHMAGPALIALLVTNFVFIPTLIETLTRGRSLGKLALGLQVVRDDGGPIRFRHAFIRALVGVGEIWLVAGMVAVLVSLFNRRGKRAADLLAGTYAASTRAARRTAPIVMPPELAQWASRADIRRLPDGLALHVRTFLSRTTTLHGGARERLGTQLSAEVSKFVAPAPPPHTHPERFLAAVSAERRNRDFQVLEVEKLRRHEQVASTARLPFRTISEPPAHPAHSAHNT